VSAQSNDKRGVWSVLNTHPAPLDRGGIPVAAFWTSPYMFLPIKKEGFIPLPIHST